MQTIPTSTYVRALRTALPEAAFAPAPWRLLWLPLHAAVIGGAIALIAAGVGGIPAAAALSLLIGHSFGSLAFVAHETLHGAVVRGRGLRAAIGWLAFLPFTLSPRLWVVW